jgi:hypothetical protein
MTDAINGNSGTSSTANTDALSMAQQINEIELKTAQDQMAVTVILKEGDQVTKPIETATR